MSKNENHFKNPEGGKLREFYKVCVNGEWMYPSERERIKNSRAESLKPLEQEPSDNAKLSDEVEEKTCFAKPPCSAEQTLLADGGKDNYQYDYPAVDNNTYFPTVITKEDNKPNGFNPEAALQSVANVDSTPMPPVPYALMSQATMQIVPVQENDVCKRERKEQRPNASVIARQFMAYVTIKIYYESIYVWLTSRYILMTMLHFKRVLNSYFRSQAEAAGTAKLYDNIIDFLLCEEQLVVTDSDRKLVENKVALKNGYLDISTMEVMPPDPGLFFMVYLNIDFQELVGNTNTPVFDSFLSAVTGGDTVLQARIMEMIGYCLSNDMNAKAFFLLQGVSNSGKSTLINLLASFFADDLLAAVPLEEIGAQFAACELFGKALNINGELGAGSIKAQNARQIKVLTGNDLISADVKYKSRVRFRNTAKLIFATNNPLYLEVNDEALVERIVVIPFAFAVPNESRNRNLMEFLKAERGGIFWKAMVAYRGLVARNYRFSGNYQLNAVCQQSKCNIAAAFVEADWLNAFLEENLIVAPDSGVFLSDVREAFEVWLNEKDIFGCKPLSDLEFGKAIRKYIPGTAFTKKRKITSANPTSYLVGYEMKKV